jgi:Uncharacterized alpha/beta hydrolase domain (DUF2235)
MKRIAVLIDGTWNKEGADLNTNVAQLDTAQKIVARAFIKPKAQDGTEQHVFYHDGVGADGGLAQRLLGGAIGLGLKQIVREVYGALAEDYAAGDEVYICGFSRGAYAARALAGLIGASGIQRGSHQDLFEIAWQHYRVKPAARRAPQTAGSADQKAVADYKSRAADFHGAQSQAIKCVAVWDTVGSYGVPAGIGLAPLARYFTLAVLGFHDTSFGNHVDVGLHAVGVDEHRRPFVPTFWTMPKGQQPRGQVEQTWFAGVHCNVGGGYKDHGLSDQALIWMIARVQALTGLEFNVDAVKANTAPNIDGAVEDSTKGWLVDHLFPHYRKVLSPVAVHHGYFFNSEAADQENINERVHWSVIAKRQNNAVPRYAPPNLPADIPDEKIAAITAEERALLGLGAGPEARKSA